MTEDEQWNTYACGPRCLVRWSEALQTPVSRSQIVSAFKPRTPAWATQCGVTHPSTVLDIARHFGLASDLRTTRDPELALTLSRDPRVGILLSTERDPTDATLKLYHFFLVEQLNGTPPANDQDPNMLLYCPLQDGASQQIPVTSSHVDAWMPTFLLLLP